MILLSSNAEHIYWLGRYLARIQFMCAQIPFLNEQTAQQFSQAFAVPYTTSDELNQLLLDPDQTFSIVQQYKHVCDNIYELRAVLSAQSYRALNIRIKQLSLQQEEIYKLAQACIDILHNEPRTDVIYVFNLGQKIEQLDIALRFKKNFHELIEVLDLNFKEEENGDFDILEQPQLMAVWNHFVNQPSLNQLNAFHQELINSF